VADRLAWARLRDHVRRWSRYGNSAAGLVTGSAGASCLPQVRRPHLVPTVTPTIQLIQLIHLAQSSIPRYISGQILQIDIAPFANDRKPASKHVNQISSSTSIQSV
jgi:hypothetical protein